MRYSLTAALLGAAVFIFLRINRVILTFDTIRDVKIYQHKNGYRFSIDAILLFSFINLKYVSKIIDLCAGSGIIGILLAKKYLQSEVFLVELQTDLAKLAKKNIISNALQDRIRIINIDIRAFIDSSLCQEVQISKKELNGLIGQFDLVVSNPPFRKLNSGRISIGDEQAIARHEIKLSLGELIHSASLLLKNYGRFCIIHLPERLNEIFSLMRQYRIEPKRLQFVHSKLGSESKMVLIECVKGARPALKVDPPFFIYNNDGSYTQEARDILYKGI